VLPGNSTKRISELESSERRESKEIRPVKSPLDPVGPAESLGDQDIDKLVPPKIMRLAQHFHNLIYIRYFFESIGQQPPEWTKAEMARADKALQGELIREHGQGGRLRSEDETR
jgi:hypothetical protein